MELHVAIGLSAQTVIGTTVVPESVVIADNDDVEWSGGKERCEDDGKTLITITSLEKSEQIKALLDQNGAGIKKHQLDKLKKRKVNQY